MISKEMDEIVMDAAHDALLALIEHPQRYDPALGSLMNYLAHIGNHKVNDQLRSLQRRRDREDAVGGIVELARVEENNYREGSNTPDHLGESATLASDIERLLYEILPDSRDRQIWELICQGRTAVVDYATVLQITHLLPCQQRIEVKRHRDRVQKRVRRQQDRFRRLL
jgi:RNA polymerase sigma-70 factor, ECF subfamily